MWIGSMPPADATGELKEIYERIGGARGGVAQIHQAQSLNPKVLATHFDLYKAVMFQPSPLTRADREALAVAVSRANSCEYCAAHHGAALSHLDAQSSLPPHVFEWAARLARTPEAVSEACLIGHLIYGSILGGAFVWLHHGAHHHAPLRA
jgi:uncharacterized peroxidase-related enzyme